MIFAMVAPVLHARFAAAVGAGAGDDEAAAHEVLVVERFHGADGFIHGEHRYEAESLRAIRVAVRHDFGVLHLAHAVEEIEEVALGGVVAEVADVEAGRGDFDALGRRAGTATVTGAFFAAAFGLFGARRLRGLFGGGASAEKGEEFVPEGDFLRCCVAGFAAVGTAVVLVAVVGPAASAAAVLAARAARPLVVWFPALRDGLWLCCVESRAPPWGRRTADSRRARTAGQTAAFSQTRNGRDTADFFTGGMPR